jgi:hypothetical protein
MIPIVGKLSDQFGRKWFLLSGTLLFLLGSLLAGASQSIEQLIAFRAVQGLGAGIGMALVSAVMGDLFPPAERAKLIVCLPSAGQLLYYTRPARLPALLRERAGHDARTDCLRAGVGGRAGSTMGTRQGGHC